MISHIFWEKQILKKSCLLHKKFVQSPTLTTHRFRNTFLCHVLCLHTNKPMKIAIMSQHHKTQVDIYSRLGEQSS